MKRCSRKCGQRIVRTSFHWEGLGRPPLLRWTLIDLGGQEHWLV